MDINWWDTALGSGDHFTAQAQQLHIRGAQLRLEVIRRLDSQSLSKTNIEAISSLIRHLRQLDQDFVSWAKSLPPQLFCPRTVAWIDSTRHDRHINNEAFTGRVDSYADIMIAALWNMYRCSRILLWAVIVRLKAWGCQSPDYRTTPEYATAATTCVNMISDIIASIPYHLGWNYSGGKTTSFPQHKLSSLACGDEQAAKCLGGYLATWPLTCILAQDYTTDSQHAWVKGRLHYISNDLGVRYADGMVNVSNREDLLIATVLLAGKRTQC